MQIRAVLKSKNRRAITIGPESTVSEAVAVLVRENIGSLPVVDGGRLVGIFTERDILRGLHLRGKEFCHAPIGEVMTADPVTCTPDDSVHDAMGRMSAHQIGQLPVLDPDAGPDPVVGLVSVGDLVRVLHEKAEEENRQLINYVHGVL